MKVQFKIAVLRIKIIFSERKKCDKTEEMKANRNSYTQVKLFQKAISTVEWRSFGIISS